MYFVMRSRGLGHEMYFCSGHNGLGTSWSFKIADALWWKTNSQPRAIVSWEDSTEVSIVSMTKQEHFKRVLADK